MENVDLAVIGGGPAGLAAALAAAEQGTQNIVVLERAETLGGILGQCIHTGFGLHYFKEELSGPEYAARFIAQVGQHPAIAVRLDTMVLDVTPHKEGGGVVTAVSRQDGLTEWRARAVILAMGCRERPRGALNIPGTRPAGILTAGAAQKLVNLDGKNPGREVVILGSGDIGLIMARRMTFEGARVKMVCELMPYSSGLTRNIVQCLDDFGIPLRLSCTVVEVHGQDRLTGVTLAKVDENRRPIPGTEEFVSCDTLLLSVGLIPENELTRQAGLALDPVTGGPVVNQSRETALPGIFACGNVLHVHDLVDYVTLESQLAGEGAAALLRDGPQKGAYVAAKGTNGVRYVVPQRVNTQAGGGVKLYFRVGQVYKGARVRATSGGRVLFNKKKQRLAPGEMEDLTIPEEVLKELTDEIVVEIEEN